MSPKKSFAIGAGIAGTAGIGRLALRRAEPHPQPASRPKPVHRPPAHRKPAQPRPTAPPTQESHTLRNAAIAGVGIAGAGALYAKWRLGPTVRGGVWRAMGALAPGMIAFARTPTELLKTRRVPWMMKKTGHGNEIAVLPVRRTAFAPTMDKARKEALTGHADAGSMIDAVRDARAQVAANVKRDRQHRLTLYAAFTPGMIAFDRPRTEAGTFAGGDTAGSPADMTAAYGHPQTRPAALTHAIAGGAAAGGAGALTAAALALLKKRRK
jgi:hypothetical protein